MCTHDLGHPDDRDLKYYLTLILCNVFNLIISRDVKDTSSAVSTLPNLNSRTKLTTLPN